MSETQEDTASLGRTRRRPLQNGAAIRSLREKDGYSQTAFAAAVGMTQANLSRIETEEQAARVVTLNRIARALRVPVAAIMRDGAAVEDVATGDAA
jgi:transcriptional regulator with XRE-family HTH domain